LGSLKKSLDSVLKNVSGFYIEPLCPVLIEIVKKTIMYGLVLNFSPKGFVIEALALIPV